MSKSKNKIEEEEESLPLSDYYGLMDYCNINKTARWWSAVVLYKDKGRRRIGLYLWQKRESGWKRIHKFVINTEEDYKQINSAIKEFLVQL